MNHAQQLREATVHMMTDDPRRHACLNAARHIERIEAEVRSWRLLVNQDPDQPFRVTPKASSHG